MTSDFGDAVFDAGFNRNLFEKVLALFVRGCQSKQLAFFMLDLYK